MAVIKTTVCIQNKSGDENNDRSYIVHFGEQDLTGGTGYSTLQPVIASIGPLSNNQQHSFTVTSELYGVLCICQDITSREMTHGSRLVLKEALPVLLGGKIDTGSSLLVKPNGKTARFDEHSSQFDADPETFRIRCDSRLGHYNNFAVGVGRRVGNSVTPVAVVQCIPGTIFTFKPNHRFYIAHTESRSQSEPEIEPRTIFKPAGGHPNRAEAEIDGTGNDINVVEVAGGKFLVNNRNPTRPQTPTRPPRVPTPTPPPTQPASQPSGAQGNRVPSTTPGGMPSERDPIQLRARQFPEYRPKTTDDEDDEFIADDGRYLDRLHEWDIVFVVDDTNSMQLPTTGHHERMPKAYKGPTRWSMICAALEYLATVAAQQDDDGIDLYFLMNKSLNIRNIKDGQSLLNQLQKINVKNSRGGTYFEPILNPILTKYIEKLDKSRGNQVVKPLDIIVLTDGAAHDGRATEKLLLRVADKLETMGKPENQVGIQFVQVGQDTSARKWMEDLYKKHKLESKRDVRFCFFLWSL